MSQRNIVLLVTAALLVVIAGFGFYKYDQKTPKPTAANAVVVTGVSVSFSEPLETKATLSITNSNGETVVSRSLESNAQRFNIGLSPGVYQVSVQQKDQPATPDITVTVSPGKLSDLTLSAPHSDEMF